MRYFTVVLELDDDRYNNHVEAFNTYAQSKRCVVLHLGKKKNFRTRKYTHEIYALPFLNNWPREEAS